MTAQLKRNFKGFTLIELMVAISIVAILATIGLVILNRAQSSARDTKRKEDLQALRNAFVLLANDNGGTYCRGTMTTGSWNVANQAPMDNLTPTYIGRLPTDPLIAANVAPGNYEMVINANCTGVVFSANLEGTPPPNLPCTPSPGRDYCIAL